MPCLRACLQKNGKVSSSLLKMPELLEVIVPSDRNREKKRVACLSGWPEIRGSFFLRLRSLRFPEYQEFGSQLLSASHGDGKTAELGFILGKISRSH